MKKFMLMFVTAMVLCIGLCGCVDSSNMQSKVPVSTVLTVDNIEEYLTFSTEITEAREVTNPYANKSICKAKLVVKTASKQNVEFNNLKIAFNVVADGRTVGWGWDTIYASDGETKFGGALDIPFTGVWEETFQLQSEFKTVVDTNPIFKFVITDVSGTAVQK